ncbi:CHCH domain containing protein [Acanthamoeba castellanii str. Neff]|uniref:CHCH domain containing protein n=1 Tax=Acanthamoeba castellanii (strain ATCC 30010 / Neff) TaxID=1257118 RepID=L8HIE2_ACACF|nr:CHCH domain containing protein [Acanthamoeba castellanii str. Neff]XP_004355042.1 CHCH domain containing protein [Acanthamoeba castellanii str. Neff]ELR23890.1 CHCH domain containing protein [Acanthamoeba castellanii str. Neff]ELR24468.1 CHCH domain containing protein [Acanthamoeba castellanii str. Neff]
MGRRGGSSRSSARPASKPTATAAPAKKAAPPATQQRAQPPATQQHAQTAPAMGGGGQSFLGGVAQMAAGYAVGHVASRAIENVIFGGHNATPEQIQKAEEQVQQGPCARPYDGFLKCLKKNEDDATECDWAYDMFKECQTTNRANRDFGYGGESKEQSATY